MNDFVLVNFEKVVYEDLFRDKKRTFTKIKWNSLLNGPTF